MSVHILIDETTAIGSDPYCWMLKRSRIRDGEIQWEPYAYFATLEYLLKAFVEARSRESDAQSMGELRRAVDRAVTTLSRALSPLGYRVSVVGPRPPVLPPSNPMSQCDIPWLDEDDSGSPEDLPDTCRKVLSIAHKPDGTKRTTLRKSS